MRPQAQKHQNDMLRSPEATSEYAAATPITVVSDHYTAFTWQIRLNTHATTPQNHYFHVLSLNLDAIPWVQCCLSW